MAVYQTGMGGQTQNKAAQIPNPALTVTPVPAASSAPQTTAAPANGAVPYPTPAGAPLPAANVGQTPQYSGGATGNMGGISPVAVNPNTMDWGSVDKYIGQSFDNSMTRLQPQMDRQRSAFEQAMLNRGIGVGNEAYNDTLQQVNQSENDAVQNAAFQAMGFGSNLQNQMFGQGLAQSQLANSLLQAQMSNQLGYAGLGENARQFDSGQNEGARRFDATFGEGQRQFNDASAQGWDASRFRDLSWLDNTNYRDTAFNTAQDWMQFNGMSDVINRIPGYTPQNMDINGLLSSVMNSQNSRYLGQSQNQQNNWSNIINGIGAFADIWDMFG